MLDLLLWIWQLPQNLVGLFLLLVFWPEESIYFHDTRVFYSKRMHGGISLGSYILLKTGSGTEINLKHEWGHTRQSRILGPFYLFVIGIPSLLKAASFKENWGESYYDFYTEKWADKLGGVQR